MAGCPVGQSDRDNDGVPDQEDDYPDDPAVQTQQRRISDTRNIEEDNWRYYDLRLTAPGRIMYEFAVEDGPAIDVIVIDQAEYDAFRNESPISPYTDLTELDSTGATVRGPVDSGTYTLILDNSNRGAAEPPANLSNDVVTVDFTIETAQ